MNKALFQQKSRHQELAEEIRIKSLISVAASKVESSSLITAESPYHQFELSFGATLLKDINTFLYLLDKSEFDIYPSLNNPLLKVCQKFLDWKIEVGSDRLWHEIRIDSSFGSGVINKAWEEVKKEQDIIDAARQAHQEHLNKMLEDYPNMPSEDPGHWCSLCDNFNEFDALQQFGYPLPFNTIFGSYPQDNSQLRGE